MRLNKTTLRLSLCFFLAVILTVIGCYVIVNRENTDTLTLQQFLRITVISDPDAPMKTISSSKLGGNFTEDIHYSGLSLVTIEINGKNMNLEDALESGYLSDAEIFYYARMDATNGFCEVNCESFLGLTHFTFQYPEFNLRILYDIYETPDGKQHLISSMNLYSPSRSIGPYTDFYDDQTGTRLDREDWGIALDVIQISDEGLSLNCIQSGGQQIGMLHISGYSLANTHTFVTRLNGSAEIPAFELPVQMNGTTEILLNWTDIYGKLPSGEYEVWLYIQDIFDESQVHPLMRDYHDMQIYPVEFSIP